MRTNIILNWILAGFLAFLTVLYTLWNVAEFGHVEWFGTIAFLACGLFSGMLAFYLEATYRRQGSAPLPEDRLGADIDDGDPEIGHFQPHSWWPITLAFVIGIVFVGMAIGAWLVLFALPAVAIAIVGWVYEDYRGAFAR